MDRYRRRNNRSRAPIIHPFRLLWLFASLAILAPAAALAQQSFVDEFDDAIVALFAPDAGLAIESALVSASPDSDPVLAAANSIELRLSLGPNIGGSLFPTGSYRLCELGSCLGDSDPPFTPLQPNPGAAGAGSIALLSSPRLTLQGIALIGVSQAFAVERLAVALPEPGLPALLLAGAGTLACLRRRRSATERQSLAL